MDAPVETKPNPSFIKGILKGLGDQKNDSDFYDLVIQVGEEEIKSHRVVLVASSGFFRGMLGSKMKEDLEQKVQLEGIPEQAFKKVLEAMYTGCDILNKENVLEIWHIANQLEILYMLTECEEFVLSILSAENCVVFYQHARLLESKKVSEASWKYLLEHFDDVSLQENILLLTFEDMKNLVQSADLVTDSEDNVIEIIVRWVTFEIESGKEASGAEIKSMSRRECLPDLLNLSRMCLVSGKCLMHTLYGNSVAQESKCVKLLIDESVAYQLMLDRRHDFCSPHAMHRNKGTFANVIVKTSSNNSTPLVCHRVYKSKQSNVGYYSSNRKDRLTGSEKICVYGNNVLLGFKSQNPDTLHFAECKIGADNSKWDTLPGIDKAHDLFSLTALGSYVFAITKGTKVSLSRLSPTSSNRKWKTVEIAEDLKEIAASTSVENTIILFERGSEATTIKCVDTAKMKMFDLTEGQFDETASFVTFRKGREAFAIQNNGILWRISTTEDPPFLNVQQETLLWDFKRTIYGVVLFNDELLVYGLPFGSAKGQDEVWEISVTGIFNRIRNVTVDERGLFALTIVPQNMLV